METNRNEALTDLVTAILAALESLETDTPVEVSSDVASINADLSGASWLVGPLF